METGLTTRFKHAWNAFLNKNPTQENSSYHNGYYYRPDRIRLTRGNERSIITSVFNRIALDVAAIDIKHCRLDDNDRYKEDIDSKLNNCLTLSSNKDQTSRALFQDIVMSMFDEGSVAIVPVDTIGDPVITDSYDIISIRTGKIVAWYPDSVKINLYNDRTRKQRGDRITKKYGSYS